jgi:cell shape-determining protein MreC
MIKLLKNTFKKTKLHTKLLITYSSFIILILIILSIFFYRYSLIILEGSVKKSFEHTVSTIKKRIDYSFNEMNSLSDRIKENNDFKNELYKFKKEEASLGNRFTYNIWMKKNPA